MVQGQDQYLWLVFRMKPLNKVWRVNDYKPPRDEWFHLMVTWKQTADLYFYIDGTLVRKGLTNWTNGNSGGTTTMTIGKSNSHNAFGSASMDEWFVWDKYVTDAQVAGFYSTYFDGKLLFFYTLGFLLLLVFKLAQHQLHTFGVNTNTFLVVECVEVTDVSESQIVTTNKDIV